MTLCVNSRMERWMKSGQTDRQTDRQAGRQTDRQKDRVCVGRSPEDVLPLIVFVEGDNLACVYGCVCCVGERENRCI